MILFTGASGFIGSHFHLAIDNQEIVNLDLRKPMFDYTSNFIQGDIRKSEDVANAIAIAKPEVIISLAAEHKDFGINEEAYFLTNEGGARIICQEAEKVGVNKIIFYSSVAVYGSNTEPSDEETTPNPDQPYGASKLAGEKVFLEWAAKDPQRTLIIIRPAVVYGERNVANMFRLINQVKSGKYFHVGNGDNIKSIAYVKNIVAATLYLLGVSKPGVHLYNYADEPQLTSREIAEVIAKSLQKRSPFTLPYWIVYAMATPFDLLIRVTGKDLPVSSNRVKKFCTQTFHQADKIIVAGFSPKFSTVDGMMRMVSWREETYKEGEDYFDI
jgi:nucleoside-diphosphate-sugar epimerase